MLDDKKWESLFVGTRGYDCGLLWGQIYRVITFCPIVDCYRGEKNIKVSRWIETLPKEQYIYYEAWFLLRGCGESPYYGKWWWEASSV